MMMQLIHSVCLIILLLFLTTVRSEDQYCMDGLKRNVFVEINEDDSQRVISYIRDEPGYQVNLQCKWVLKPVNYENPRQMYIQVPVVDFDTDNATEAHCNNSTAQLDVLSLKLKRNDTVLKDERWCSKKSVQIRQRVVNMWDPTYSLELEFRSDNKQVRSDAKGVQVDMQVLGRDYCHRSMLYFEESCYFITSEPLTQAEAFRTAKNFLGNVFTIPSSQDVPDFLRLFFQRNSDRQKAFPFVPPLTLNGSKMWTGYIATFLDNPPASARVLSVEYSDPLKDCKVSKQQLTVSLGMNVRTSCAIALLWSSNGGASFTCEPMHMRLPALIEFKQIPATKDNMHPQLFRTCDSPPDLKQQKRGFNCEIGCLISLGAAIATIGFLVVFCACCIYCSCCRKQDSPWEEFVIPQYEDEPLKV